MALVVAGKYEDAVAQVGRALELAPGRGGPLWIRGMALEQVQALIAAHTQQASLGFIGTARVNVTELNVALVTSRAAAAGQ